MCRVATAPAAPAGTREPGAERRRRPARRERRRRGDGCRGSRAGGEDGTGAHTRPHTQTHVSHDNDIRCGEIQIVCVYGRSANTRFIIGFSERARTARCTSRCVTVVGAVSCHSVSCPRTMRVFDCPCRAFFLSAALGATRTDDARGSLAALGLAPVSSAWLTVCARGVVDCLDLSARGTSGGSDGTGCTALHTPCGPPSSASCVSVSRPQRKSPARARRAMRTTPIVDASCSYPRRNALLTAVGLLTAG